MMKIRFERLYPHPPEVVWPALTDARAIKQWWVDSDFAPEVGREFYFKDAPRGSWDGLVRGKVLEVRAPTWIRFSWTGGGHDTTVSYELAAAPNGGTKLILIHDGFRGVSGLLLSVMLRFGWRSLVRTLLPQMAEHIAAAGIEVPFPQPSKAARVGRPMATSHE
jgi:uncharacterized protein YndB with AHSA1/START domain